MRLDNQIHRLVRALKGEAIYLYGMRFGAILLQSVTVFVVAAVIGIEEFGRFTFMYSASQIMTVILGAGSPLFLQRTLPVRDVRSGGMGNSNIVATCLLRTAVLAGLCLVVLLCANLYLHGDVSFQTGQEALLILLTGFLLNILQIFIAVVRVARTATYSMMLRDLVPYLGFLAGIGISVLLGYNSAEAVMLVFSASVFAAASVSIVSSGSYLMARISREKISAAESGRYMTFWGSSITGASLAQVDILLARAFLDDRSLGIYSLLRRVSNLISMPQVIANWTISVRVAKDFERGDKAALQKHATYGVLLSLPVAVVMFLLIAVLSPLWLTFFHVDPGIEIVALLTVLLVAQLVNVLSGANALFAMQCREEAYIFKLRLMSLVVSVAAMFVGAMLLDSMGIALGVLLGMALLNGMLLYHIKKRVGVWTSIPFGFITRG